MAAIPVMLDVGGRRCVIVGGGAVALRRARTLHEAGAQVIVIAPQVEPPLREMQSVSLEWRRYAEGDLAGAAMVVIATDDVATNGRVRAEATVRGVLINDATAGDEGDLHFMAAHRDGPLTVAIHTGGASASAAGTIRDELASALDADWPTLLTEAAARRPEMQGVICDPVRRGEVLRRLTGDQARHVLKSRGLEALRAYHRALIPSG